MERPTFKEIKAAGRRSAQAALDMAVRKYVYLLGCDRWQLRELPGNFIYTQGCSLCVRYAKNGKCPLKQNCKLSCISEWDIMESAYRALKTDSSPGSYYKFMSFASVTLIKLLKLKGVIE